MKSEPLVGVVVCTYNRPKHLVKALNIIKNQEYKNHTVIVIDDFSDCAEENLNICRDHSDGVAYVCNKRHAGISYTRNEGLKFLMSRKNIDLICMLDDDDHWNSNRLGNGVESMREDVGMSFGIQQMADEYLNPIQNYPCNINYFQVRLHALLFGEFFFPAKTYMFNTEFLKEIQLSELKWYFEYDEREDIELGVRALQYAHLNPRWKVKYINQILAYWIQNPNRLKFDNNEYRSKQQECYIPMAKKYLPRYLQKFAISLAPYLFRLPRFVKFSIV